ncbi:PAS domain S-box protein [Nitrincola sp.]|uniref:PAS domain S-box protein n=1 Tax=Nitrincola sp. TaxID=1926584 RepID=UPI003A95C1E2
MLFNFQNLSARSLDQTTIAVVTIDNNNRVIYYNDSAELLWGYSRKEVLGQNVKMLVPRDHQSSHDNYVNRHREQGGDRIVGSSREVPIERKDGSKSWISLTLSAIKVGKQQYYTAFARDCSIERAERSVVEQVLEQTNDGVITIDAKNEIIFANPAAEALWGYSREELMGKNVKMLVAPDHQANHDGYVNRNRQTGINRIIGKPIELPIHTRSGKVRWGLFTLARIVVGDQVLFTAFVKDVTEEVLKRDEIAMLSLVANKTSNAVIITDKKGAVVYSNNGFEMMTGYTLDQVKGRIPGSFLQGPDTNPETVEHIRTKLKHAEPFYEEILNYTCNGKPYWIAMSIDPVFDDRGQISHFVSVQADITHTKQSAKDSMDRLSLMDEALMVVEWQPTGQVAHMNALFLDRAGNTDTAKKAAATIWQQIQAEKKNIGSTQNAKQIKLIVSFTDHNESYRVLWRQFALSQAAIA